MQLIINKNIKANSQANSNICIPFEFLNKRFVTVAVVDHNNTETIAYIFFFINYSHDKIILFPY